MGKKKIIRYVYVGLLLTLFAFLSACSYLGIDDNTVENTIFGTVTLGDNLQVEDINIILTYGQEEEEITGLDNNGDYQFTGLANGDYLLKFTLKEEVSKEKEVSVYTGKIFYEINVELIEENTVITGFITVEHNFPTSVVEENINSLSMETANVKNDYDNLSKIPAQQIFTDEVIIGFVPGLTKSRQEEIINETGYQRLKSNNILNAAVIQVPTGIKQAVNILKEKLDIEYAEINYLVESFDLNIPNDPDYSKQWHYPQIRLPQAWSVVTGSSNIRVAVIDTGVYYDHPDLQAQLDLENAFNFITGDNNANDDQGHGTHVAGTIGATTNNNEGVAGVMWDCTLLPLKVLNEEGTGSLWDVANAILYAAGIYEEQPNPAPVDIINLSLGSPGYSTTLHNAVKAAHNQGIILVAASGNENESEVYYPAAYEEVIAVGAVNYNGGNTPVRAFYSNYGNKLDVVAPGGDDNNGVHSTIIPTVPPPGPRKSYDGKYGTSMAAPHVAGLVGLMLSNGISPENVREILHNTSMAIGDGDFDIEYGYGLVNAYWAVNDVQNIRVIIGTRDEDTVEVVSEASLDLKGGSYIIENVPTGTYQLIAWIDVLGNNIIDPGDYFYESSLIEFQNDQYNYNLTLTEIFK